MEKLLTTIDLTQFGAGAAVIGILLCGVLMLWYQNRELRKDLKEERDYNREREKIVQEQQLRHIQTLRDLQENLAILLDRS